MQASVINAAAWPLLKGFLDVSSINAYMCTATWSPKVAKLDRHHLSSLLARPTFPKAVKMLDQLEDVNLPQVSSVMSALKRGGFFNGQYQPSTLMLLRSVGYFPVRADAMLVAALMHENYESIIEADSLQVTADLAYLSPYLSLLHFEPLSRDERVKLSTLLYRDKLTPRKALGHFISFAAPHRTLRYLPEFLWQHTTSTFVNDEMVGRAAFKIFLNAEVRSSLKKYVPNARNWSALDTALAALLNNNLRGVFPKLTGPLLLTTGFKSGYRGLLARLFKVTVNTVTRVLKSIDDRTKAYEKLFPALKKHVETNMKVARLESDAKKCRNAVKALKRRRVLHKTPPAKKVKRRLLHKTRPAKKVKN